MTALSGVNMYAQEGTPEEPVDTSYFRTGGDDWNLVESVIRENPDAVLMLLKRGAKIDVRSAYKQTPLHVAVLHDHMEGEIIEALIAAGAKLKNVKKVSKYWPSVAYAIDK